MTEISIRGAEDLERLAKQLKEAGRNDLRKELLAGIRASVKPIISDIRDRIRERLPSSGGLADRVATATISARTRLTGKSAGVSLIGKRGKSMLSRLNEGILKHPLYGNRSHWHTQAVEPGWFDKAIIEDLDLLQKNIIDAMERVAEKVAQGV